MLKNKSIRPLRTALPGSGISLQFFKSLISLFEITYNWTYRAIIYTNLNNANDPESTPSSVLKECAFKLASAVWSFSHSIALTSIIYKIFKYILNSFSWSFGISFSFIKSSVWLSTHEVNWWCSLLSFLYVYIPHSLRTRFMGLYGCSWYLSLLYKELEVWFWLPSGSPQF